ncbi:MAG: glycosyltransferase family 2 protein [Candidatus Bathyarchaeia archaeon]|jgi:cellulose synthase/poly-beta-1,6-N-acetylglucosamine synthase-like glycosyltransferase
MNALPSVSIVVTCRNNAQTIGECLQALVNQDYPEDALEILVVDACSTDGTADIARQYTPHVFCEPLNAAAAYNYALSLAHHGILGFVDSDAKVEPSWLKTLVPHLDEAQVAGVSGSIETWNPQNPWARSIGYEIKNRYSRIGKYTGRIATMNLLLKRSVIEEVGGWDENFPSQYDTDFGYRMSRLGYKIAYEPNAKCYHYNRPTVHAFWRQQLQYGKNTTRLYFKHGRLARGDEITDVGMNLQPALYLAVFACALLGVVPLLRPLWYVSGGLLAAIFVYYVYSASKLSMKFHDATAMRMVVLYYVRVFAWLTGAAKFLFTDRRKKRT